MLLIIIYFRRICASYALLSLQRLSYWWYERIIIFLFSFAISTLCVFPSCLSNWLYEFIIRNKPPLNRGKGGKYFLMRERDTKEYCCCAPLIKWCFVQVWCGGVCTVTLAVALPFVTTVSASSRTTPGTSCRSTTQVWDLLYFVLCINKTATQRVDNSSYNGVSLLYSY